MKINRLFHIVITLLNKGTVTAKELAEKFEVSTRTIYRDVEDLSAAGIPIYTSKGNGGGISLLEEYVMSNALISAEESESLILALKTLQATNYPEIDRVLEKMNAIFGKTHISDWIEVDFSHWGANKDTDIKFQNIKQGILKRIVLGFDYINSYNKKTRRLVYPLKLIFKGQTWYLWSYCILKDDFRLFKITRMKNLEVKNQNFERGDIISKGNEKIITESKVKKVNLRLKFNESVLYLLYDYYDEDMIVKDQDGSYIVNVTFPENEWVYSYIMSFGYNVEVIEPKYVRDEIVKRLNKNLDIYKS
ncbi:YafY family transcriptional regulator [Clostridium sp. MSJ-4]|uniref:YafY family transcriptional regulator n=1 Tax=Clostridium simiarum TaxID=2841506 RepID=A0ABS6EZW6_9CLOT|nr:YafY family protein [Clostridium simiarum]MBU5591528.1 YafY family transcriptional regulator [Clostridium simiarum]